MYAEDMQSVIIYHEVEIMLFGRQAMLMFLSTITNYKVCREVTTSSELVRSPGMAIALLVKDISIKYSGIIRQSVAIAIATRYILY